MRVGGCNFACKVIKQNAQGLILIGTLSTQDFCLIQSRKYMRITETGISKIEDLPAELISYTVCGANKVECKVLIRKGE